MKIRKAETKDLGVILEIYEFARSFMAQHDNPTQWGDGYPKKDLLEADIDKGQLYVVTDDDDSEIYTVYAYIIGADSTYAYIENGAWLNDEPYGTVHRVASSGKAKGTAHFIFNWALTQCDNLRGDTHHDNYVMQNVFKSFGMKECGVIYVEDGSPRIAYQIKK